MRKTIKRKGRVSIPPSCPPYLFLGCFLFQTCPQKPVVDFCHHTRAVKSRAQEMAGNSKSKYNASSIFVLFYLWASWRRACTCSAWDLEVCTCLIKDIDQFPFSKTKSTLWHRTQTSTTSPPCGQDPERRQLKSNTRLEEDFKARDSRSRVSSGNLDCCFIITACGSNHTTVSSCKDSQH